jgi:hypothetical protein
MARESSLWKWLSDARQTMRERVDLRRVEDSIGAGFPDVDGGALFPSSSSFATLEDILVFFPFKLELKSEVRPVRPTTPIRFKLEKRRAQIEFMRKRYAMGEAAYFLLQVGEGADRLLYLAPGDAGERLRAGLMESELALLCATENGMIFDKKAKPQNVLEGIQKCFKRRRLP